MPLLYDYPRMCAECYQLNVKKQMNDRGEQRYYYQCDKLKRYVDARNMVNGCKEGMKRFRSNDDYTDCALRGERW